MSGRDKSDVDAALRKARARNSRTPFQRVPLWWRPEHDFGQGRVKLQAEATRVEDEGIGVATLPDGSRLVLGLERGDDKQLVVTIEGFELVKKREKSERRLDAKTLDVPESLFTVDDDEPARKPATVTKLRTRLTIPTRKRKATPKKK